MNGSVDDAGGALARQGFAALLRHWRKRTGLSQAQLGARLGYHHSVISRWESGGRVPPLKLVRRLDDLLGTGGALAELVAAAASHGTEAGRLLGLAPHAPLPGGVTADGRGVVLWDVSGWPARLPHYGLRCPLHGGEGCDVPPADQALALYERFTAEPLSFLDTETVHMLAAQLAVYARLAEERALADICGVIEAALHILTRPLQLVTGDTARPLLHLAATYAGLAAQQRLLRGQHGAAMALYGKGLHWAMLCDDLPLRVALMCDMSSMARLENDGISALAYARALSAVDQDLSWVSALSHLYQARGYGMLGDLGETIRGVGLARAGFARAAQRHELDGTWMSGAQGHVVMEAGAGGALRDAAAAAADRAVARSAIVATGQALAFIPAQMVPARVQMTLRLADCYACAGEPDAAVAIAAPVLVEAATMTSATVMRELHGLRARLASRWPQVGPVRDFLDRGQGLAGFS